MEATHRCDARTVWEVDAIITGSTVNGCPRYRFYSDAGKLVTALAYEAEVIEPAPPPNETFTFEEFYEQPDLPPRCANDFNKFDADDY